MIHRATKEQVGLAIRDDYQVPVADEQEDEKLTARILAALAEVLRRCEGPSQRWTRRNLKRAMVLIGGLDEKVAREIVEQEDT